MFPLGAMAYNMPPGFLLNPSFAVQALNKGVRKIHVHNEQVSLMHTTADGGIHVQAEATSCLSHFHSKLNIQKICMSSLRGAPFQPFSLCLRSIDWRPHHAGNDGGDCGGGEVAVIAVADGGEATVGCSGGDEATVGCSGGDEAVVAGTKAMQLLQAIDGVAVVPLSLSFLSSRSKARATR
nr:VHS domain-containing protein At3g16270 [Ipomoea trifida]